MVQLLGFEITRKDNNLEKPAEGKQETFTIPSPDDGVTTISVVVTLVNTWIWRSQQRMTMTL